jgi:hypothetical protein
LWGRETGMTTKVEHIVTPACAGAATAPAAIARISSERRRPTATNLAACSEVAADGQKVLERIRRYVDNPLALAALQKRARSRPSRRRNRPGHDLRRGHGRNRDHRRRQGRWGARLCARRRFRSLHADRMGKARDCALSPAQGRPHRRRSQ